MVAEQGRWCARRRRGPGRRPATPSRTWPSHRVECRPLEFTSASGSRSPLCTAFRSRISRLLFPAIHRSPSLLSSLSSPLPPRVEVRAMSRVAAVAGGSQRLAALVAADRLSPRILSPPIWGPVAVAFVSHLPLGHCSPRRGQSPAAPLRCTAETRSARWCWTLAATHSKQGMQEKVHTAHRTTQRSSSRPSHHAPLTRPPLLLAQTLPRPSSPQSVPATLTSPSLVPSPSPPPFPLSVTSPDPPPPLSACSALMCAERGLHR